MFHAYQVDCELNAFPMSTSASSFSFRLLTRKSLIKVFRNMCQVSLNKPASISPKSPTVIFHMVHHRFGLVDWLCRSTSIWGAHDGDSISVLTSRKAHHEFPLIRDAFKVLIRPQNYRPSPPPPIDREKNPTTPNAKLIVFVHINTNRAASGMDEMKLD